MNKTNRAAFVHVQEEDHWRVYDALWMEKTSPTSSRLCYIDDGSAMRFVDTQEYRQRCSAIYYVMDWDFMLMANDIEADWKARKLWSEAHDDVLTIRLRRIVEQDAKGGE